MKRMYLLTIALLLSAHTAFAAPVTLGSWHPMPGMNNDADPFFDNESWDCPPCNVGYSYPATEWLDPVPWTVDANTFTDLGGMSAYLGEHTFGRDASGALWLNSGHGYTASSAIAGQVLLLRRVHTASIDYWAAFEDLPVTGSTDRDFNDRVFYWNETVPGLDDPKGPPRGVPAPRDVDTVPEPALLAMMGAALLAAFRRR